MNEVDQAESWKGRLPSPGCLFAITVLVIVASVGGWLRWRAHRQQARIDFFLQFGGVVDTRQEQQVWLRDLITATLGEDHAGGAVIVTRLYLSETEVTDADLEHLSGFSDLEGLWLDNTQITDAGLQHLSDLTHLQELHIVGTQVTDAGIEEVQSQLPGVEIVR